MEIKTELIKLEEGSYWVEGEENYLITEEHTLTDIIRFAISQSSYDEIKYLVDSSDQEDQKLCADAVSRSYH